jgi:hypothetical protein
MLIVSHYPTPTLIIIDGQAKKNMGCSHNQMSQKTCQEIATAL